MEAKKITTVVFDMGQVLIHWTPFSVTDHLGLSEEDMSILLGEMFQSVEWVSLDHGTLTREQAVEAILDGKLEARNALMALMGRNLKRE